jgi:hypothetical protein
MLILDVAVIGGLALLIGALVCGEYAKFAIRRGAQTDDAVISVGSAQIVGGFIGLAVGIVIAVWR